MKYDGDNAIVLDVLQDKVFWLSIASFIVARSSLVPWDLTFLSRGLSAVGAVASFGLAYYVFEGYRQVSRLQRDLYRAQHLITNAATLSSAMLHKDKAAQLMRHLMAAMASSFQRLDDTIFQARDREWKLLTAEEREQIYKKSSPDAFGIELLAWCFALIHAAERELQTSVSDELRRDVRDLQAVLDRIRHSDAFGKCA